MTTDDNGIVDFSFENNLEEANRDNIFKLISSGTNPENTQAINMIKDNYGKNILQYKVKNKNGEEVSLGNLNIDNEKPTVVIFSYPMCGGCQDMMKFMSKINHDKYNLIEVITSVNNNNFKENVENTEKIFNNLGAENLLEHIVYDEADLIWQTRLNLKTTPNILFLDKYGRLIGASGKLTPIEFNDSMKLYCDVDDAVEGKSLGDIVLEEGIAMAKPFKTIYGQDLSQFELTNMMTGKKETLEKIVGKGNDKPILISLGTSSCSNCVNSWKTFPNEELEDFTLIEGLIDDYSEEKASDLKKQLIRQHFQTDENDKRLEHFYYDAYSIFSLPNKLDSSVMFTGTPVGIILDKDFKVRNYVDFPSYTEKTREKIKRVAESVYKD